MIISGNTGCYNNALLPLVATEVNGENLAKYLGQACTGCCHVLVNWKMFLSVKQNKNSHHFRIYVCNISIFQDTLKECTNFNPVVSF